MAEQFFSDTVDSSGYAHPTVGENIRKGAKMTNALDVTAEDLKHAIVSMLSGERFHFGIM